MIFPLSIAQLSSSPHFSITSNENKSTPAIRATPNYQCLLTCGFMTSAKRRIRTRSEKERQAADLLKRNWETVILLCRRKGPRSHLNRCSGSHDPMTKEMYALTAERNVLITPALVRGADLILQRKLNSLSTTRRGVVIVRFNNPPAFPRTCEPRCYEVRPGQYRALAGLNMRPWHGMYRHAA